MIIMKNPEGPPFTGKDQLRKAITIQIAPHRSANQASFRKSFRVFRVQFPRPAMVVEKHGRGGLRIASRKDAPPDKQTEMSVPIEIRQSERPGAARLARQTVVNDFTAKIELPHARAGCQTILVIRRADQQNCFAVLDPRGDARLVGLRLTTTTGCSCEVEGVLQDVPHRPPVHVGGV